MLDLKTLWRLYRGRLRLQPLAELFALLGIAAAVALLFAVQVANKSVTGSFEELSRGVAGKASLEVAARGPQGFDQRLFFRIERLREVERAAPVVERRVAVSGPAGRKPLTLFGTDDRLTRLGGELVERFGQRSQGLSSVGIYLTEPTARTIGVSRGQSIQLEVGARRLSLPLAGVLAEDDIGSLAQSPVALAPLGYAQQLAGMKGRVSRVLVAPVAGKEAKVKASLSKLAAGRLNVRQSDAEASLLQRAASGDRQSSALFSAISLVVGMLLAYNAMLLTMGERRQFVASLNLLAARRSAIVTALLFETLILGLAGSALGILLGDQLSRYAIHQVPSFLASAFAIGEQRIVTAETVALAMIGGTLAAFVAGIRPAISVLRLDPLDALSDEEPDVADTGSAALRVRLFFLGLGVLALYLALVLLFPNTTLTVGLLVAGVVFVLPALVTRVVVWGNNLSRKIGGVPTQLSVSELAATPTRATALAATGTLAMFAIVGMVGTSNDVKRGVDQVTANVFQNADLWVVPGGRENAFRSIAFNHRELSRRLRALPEVASVRPFRASFLDQGDRRFAVVGEPPDTKAVLAPTQVVEGNAERADRLVRQGGWAAITRTAADERDLKLGQRFSLPTPSGERSFRLAAKVTNYGWEPGMILISGYDYAEEWGRRTATELEVDLAPAVGVAAGRRAVAAALRGSALSVQLPDKRAADSARTARQGLARLQQISVMVLVAVGLAAAAALLGAAWERRARLWSLVSLGMSSGQLYRMLFLEVGVILLVGCVIGAAFGILFQGMMGRWLEHTTAYPVPFEPALGLAVETFAAVTLLAIVATIVPARLAFPVRGLRVFTPET